MTTSEPRGRFAPSTTGQAHPGTLLAALLAWLDMRHRGGQVLLRLEDLDKERCQPAFAAAMQADLQWLGLDWDAVHLQSDHGAQHDAALERLAQGGHLYACACSRQQLRAHGVRAADGGFVYPNTCRLNRLTAATWRTAQQPLRAALPAGTVEVLDLGGRTLRQDPTQAMGDPVVRRRDGAVAYHLAVVVDDAHFGVTDVVRGHDIAPSTATQVALQHLLGLPTPRYRHHLLLVEPRGPKLAKLHGSIGAAALRQKLTSTALCGFLAHAAGLRPTAAPLHPRELVASFDWQQVATRDVIVRWDGAQLHAESLPAT